MRCEANRHSRIKKKEYLKDKINELAKNSKNKNIRDLFRRINEFKRGCQPRSNLMKDENGVLLAYSQNILNRWKNYFPQLLNVHSISDVQIEVPTAELIVPDPSPFEVETVFVKLRNYGLLGSDQILAELIVAEGETLLRFVNSFTLFGKGKNFWISRRRLLMYLFK
jgi:hypothetical protein